MKTFEQRKNGLYLIQDKKETLVIKGKLKCERDKNSLNGDERYIIKFNDPNGDCVQLKIAAKDLHGKEAIYKMASAGLQIFPGSEMCFKRYILKMVTNRDAHRKIQ